MKFWQLKLWRLNFVLALAIIFCSPQGPHVSSLEAGSLRSCAASLALSAACLFGSACAPVHKTSDHRAARSQALSEVTADLIFATNEAVLVSVPPSVINPMMKNFTDFVTKSPTTLSNMTSLEMAFSF